MFHLGRGRALEFTSHAVRTIRRHIWPARHGGRSLRWLTCDRSLAFFLQIPVDPRVPNNLRCAWNNPRTKRTEQGGCSKDLFGDQGSTMAILFHESPFYGAAMKFATWITVNELKPNAANDKVNDQTHAKQHHGIVGTRYP